MDDAEDAVTRKVLVAFSEIVGDRSRRLDPTVVATHAMDTIREAFLAKYGIEKADDIAFHMADWNWDAAFIVALHLFPERFASQEIEEGVRRFLVHAPNHIRAACKLTGYYVWENFAEDDQLKS
jgi:hypothetical protein